MTKKDGDKLRAMQETLTKMAAEYEAHTPGMIHVGSEASDMRQINAAIEFLLRGYKFKVTLG